MPSNKSQHYVPKLYLRNFSRDRKSIALYNLDSDRSVSNAPIKGQCQRPYLYGKDGAIEKIFGEFESTAAVQLTKLIQLRIPPREHTRDHVNLIFFLLLQHARTVYAGDERKENHERLIKHIREANHADESFNLEEMEKAFGGTANPLTEVLRTTIPMYPLLLDLRGILLLNATSQGFITSDNPVVLYNQLLEKRTFVSNTGLQSVGLQIFLPISSDVAILYYDRDVYGVGRRNSISITVKNPVDVRQLNAIQFLNAAENIYYDDRRNNHYQLSKEFQAIRGRRRRQKMNVVSQLDSQIKIDETKDLIGFYREDVRSELCLSFMTILKRAKAATERLMVKTYLRNPILNRKHDRFQELVRQGLVDAGSWLDYDQQEN
jgi:Protein of unknown function (DUF4238)